ncbi:MAG: hypothetical protein KKD44_06460 [Proteobacteria bacterium]|nr:hypothetical protein [Pseudomonadota bacterium]
MSNQPESGKVIFYDKCLPPFLAGDYDLKVRQTMTKDGGVTPVDDEAPSGKKIPTQKIYPFTVTGPRFTLQPDEIHAAYPPPNSDGPYEARLPCVVLKRRTLPWERVAGQVGGEKLPWLALMIFEESEVTLLDPPSCTVGSVLTHMPSLIMGGGAPWPSNILAATLTDAERAKPCLGIEVKKSIFDQVAPNKKELRLLTHVRQVNTQDKELLGQDKDGWFSVVVGNRLPVSGKKYVACLVSLEQQAGILPDNHEPLTTPRGTGMGYVVSPEMAYRTAVNLYLRELQTTPDGPDMAVLNRDPKTRKVLLERYMGAAALQDQNLAASLYQGTLAPGQFTYNTDELSFVLPEPTIRMICLARWTFQCVGKGDFQGLMESLPESGGIGMLGMHPDQTTNSATTPSTSYRLALDSGHVPLKHLTRNGENKISFYRGPFTPVGIYRNLNEGPYHDADQARRVDPLTGLENVGYAAAFEIGRLMALADPKFALDLLKWRRSGHRNVGDRLIGNRIKDRLIKYLDMLDPRQFLDDRCLASALLDRVGPRILNEEILGALTDPTGLKGLRDMLPGLDPARVMESMNLNQAQVESMLGVAMDTGLTHGSIQGSGSLFDQVGVAGAGLAMDFDSVVARVGTEFGHVSLNHDREMDQVFDQFKQGAKMP